jgi:hypothetical protein
MQEEQNHKNEKSSSCYLSDVLSSFHRRGSLDASTFRKYRSTVDTVAKLRGNVDTALKHIVYNVGQAAKANVILARHSDVVPMCDASVRIGDYTASDFAGAAKKYVSFGGDFSTMDLAGVVERLGKSLGVYSMGTELTCELIRGGGNVELVAVGNASAPVVPGSGTVWVPRSVDADPRPNTFAALLAAVNGEDGTVVTDVLNLDGRGNVIVPDVSGAALAEGCYHALRVLGANYEAAAAGDVFAYALTRGIHAAITVVGQSDEGAHMRSVLRVGRFQVPYGGIDVRKTDYLGMPRAMSVSAKSYSGLVDSIGLATAAAVAECDPLVQFEGRLFPTVITSSCASRQNAGATIPFKSTVVGGDLDALAKDIGAQVADEGSKFAPIYAKALGHIFTITGASGMAVRHMRACFTWAAMTVDRHLALPAVAPWFWIEPTSLSRLPSADFPAVAAGYGRLCEPGREGVMPLFPSSRVVGESDGLVGLEFEWRSARTVGAMVHLALHPLNGLSNIVVRQADASAFALLGAGLDVESRIRSNTTIDKYLWGRGHSMLPCPAEALYLRGSVGVMVKTTTSSLEDDFDVLATHMFNGREMMDGELSLRCTKPAVINSGKLTSQRRSISMLRSTALDALGRARRHAGWDLVDGFMQPCVSGLISRQLGSTEVGQVPKEPGGQSEQIAKSATPLAVGGSAGRIGDVKVGVSVTEGQDAAQVHDTKTGPPATRVVVADASHGPGHPSQAPHSTFPRGGTSREDAAAPEAT